MKKIKFRREYRIVIDGTITPGSPLPVCSDPNNPLFGEPGIDDEIEYHVNVEESDYCTFIRKVIDGCTSKEETKVRTAWENDVIAIETSLNNEVDNV
jgi:hypothetical protein